jgi:Tfp pilus assembly protein PilN
MPRVFEEISRTIPESAVINTLNMTPADLHFWGVVFKRNEAAETILSRFVLSLSLSPLFKEVKLVQAVKNNDYSVEAFNFEITAKISEGG